MKYQSKNWRCRICGRSSCDNTAESVCVHLHWKHIYTKWPKLFWFHIEQVHIQTSTLADIAKLGAGHAPIDRYLLVTGPTAANLPVPDGTDRQTDGWTHDSCTNSAPHAVQVVPTVTDYITIHTISSTTSVNISLYNNDRLTAFDPGQPG